MILMMNQESEGKSFLGRLNVRKWLMFFYHAKLKVKL